MGSASCYDWSMAGRASTPTLKVLALQLMELAPVSDDTQFLANQAEWSLVIHNLLDEIAYRQIAISEQLVSEILAACPGYSAIVGSCRVIRTNRNRELVSA